jgi:uncharacterized membrane protein
MATALPETVRGIPLHPLVIHAVVVLVPLAVLGALGAVIRPSFRRHFGVLLVLVTLLATLVVPLATGSGENLERRLGAQQLVEKHSHYAERMLPAMLVLLASVVVLVALDVYRRTAPSSDVPPAALAAPARTTVIDRWLGDRVPAGWRTETGEAWARRAEIVVAVIVVVAAVTAAVVVFQTGESGAQAVWSSR